MQLFKGGQIEIEYEPDKNVCSGVATDGAD